MVDGASPMVAAGLGILAGFLTSVPGGPINATLIAEGARRGIRWCLFLGFGAVLMEAAYCTVAFAGFARVFESRWVRATMELASFLLMLWLGVKYLRGNPIPGTDTVEHFVEERFHPHTAFWTGFLRVLGNPGVLLLWVTVAATLLSRDWLENRWESKWPFVSGVAVGGMAWFALVGWGVSRGGKGFSVVAMRRMSQTSGFLLLVVAVIVGAQLIALLANHHTALPLH